MHLTDLSIVSSNCNFSSATGCFSGDKSNEIIISRGSDELELLRLDSKNGKILTIARTSVFGVIRSLGVFRLPGESKDFICIGSDSGRLTILEYLPSKQKFVKLVQETFGKRGCCRAIAGQYLSVDPNGRAIMTGAFDKQKLVYICSRDQKEGLKVSSPLEAHKSHIVTFDVCSLDVGFDNPIFSCIEAESNDIDPLEHPGEKSLVFYELDLGLNHVVRKLAVDIPETSHKLIPVPQMAGGPGGLFVCSQDHLTWLHPSRPKQQLNLPLPRREGAPAPMIIAGSVFSAKSKLFLILQNETGDLFKISFEALADGLSMDRVELKYFDTIPRSSEMHLFKSGFLYSASESGTDYLFQIVGLAEDAPVLSDCTLSDQRSTTHSTFFRPELLRNLNQVHTIEGLSSVVDGKVVNFAGIQHPQFLTLTAAGPLSQLNVSRFGIEPTEQAGTELPGAPTGLWSLSSNSSYTASSASLVAVSFVNATVVLQISDEEGISEVANSGFLSNTQTLHVRALADGSYIQVTKSFVRHIRKQSEHDVLTSEWIPPSGQNIYQCASNKYQLVIATCASPFEQSGAGTSYVTLFSVDAASQSLLEIGERKKIQQFISALSLEPVAEGRVSSRLIAVACRDQSLRLYKMGLDGFLEDVSMTVLPDVVFSLRFYRLDEDTSAVGLCLSAGLSNGLLVSLDVLDTGFPDDTPRMRFLGSSTPQIFSLTDMQSIIVVGTSAFLAQGFHLVPLLHDETPAFLCRFGTDNEEMPRFLQIGSSNILKIYSLDLPPRSKFGTLRTVAHSRIALPSNPKKILTDHPSLFAVTLSPPENLSKHTEPELENGSAMDSFSANSQDGSTESSMFSRLVVGMPLQTTYSAIQFFSHNYNLLNELRLPLHEVLIAAHFVQFHGQPFDQFLIVSTATGLESTLANTYSTSHLLCYRLEHDFSLALLHRTDISDVGLASAFVSYHGRLLVGFMRPPGRADSAPGAAIRLYDLGVRKMLLKCHLLLAGSHGIVNLFVPSPDNAYRFVAVDIANSATVLTYRPSENAFLLVADDLGQRWISAATPLDYDSVAVADKFGQFSVLRLSHSISHEIDYDETGAKLLSSQGALGGAPFKLDSVAEMFHAHVIVALQQTTLVYGSSGPVLVYFTCSGKIGAMVPMTSRADLLFFQKLELALRELFYPKDFFASDASNESATGLDPPSVVKGPAVSMTHSPGAAFLEDPGLAGNEHAAYVSSYVPVRGVIDGTLLETFEHLSLDRQRSIADQIEAPSASFVARRIQDFRLFNAF